jgi:transposase
LVSAWKLDKELFGWRSFAIRQLGASLGLTPTPYDSGNSQIEQGISKAGNKRLRSLLVELAWSWLRYQPDSALSHWYGRRFATAGNACVASASWRLPGGWPSLCGDT